MTRLPYELVDVFTSAAFAGNPLAVVLGADALRPAQRQALAAEFHLSETAFPVAPSSPQASYRVYIHTPEVELPFAGHPSVGTAWVLRAAGRLGTAAQVVQECGAGLLPVRFRPGGAVELTGADPVVGPELDPVPLRAAAGLAPRHAGAAGLPAPRRAGTGIEFTFLPVDAADLDAATPLTPASPPAGRPADHTGLVLVHWQDDRAEVRVFAGGVGVAEDPATGSAATALGAYLVAAGLLPGEGESRVEVSQGRHVGRPSALSVTVLARAGAAAECRVAGQVVPVGAGAIEIPPG